MGGASTEISESTRDVLLEMAWWDPPTISRAVKRLNLPSEASTRFRPGADWGENIDRSCRRFCQLAAEAISDAVDGGSRVARTAFSAPVIKIAGIATGKHAGQAIETKPTLLLIRSVTTSATMAANVAKLTSDGTTQRSDDTLLDFR